MNSRAVSWIISFAAGLSIVSFSGLYSRWCADGLLGWGLTLGGLGLGLMLTFLLSSPDEPTARIWAIVGVLAALSSIALLRFFGLALAEATLLRNPLGPWSHALFVLGQASILLILTSIAWTQTVRGRLSSAAVLVGLILALVLRRFVEPSVLIATAAVGVLIVVLLLERPWSHSQTSISRSRFFILSAVVATGIATQSPGLMKTVWMARLHQAYPGGDFLSHSDDGQQTWSAYVFSNGEVVSLRDGVIQSWDVQSLRLALWTLIGQFDNSSLTVNSSVLMIEPPDPSPAGVALNAGAIVTVKDGPPAQKFTVDTIGGEHWRKDLASPASDVKPNAALVFLTHPSDFWQRRRLTGMSNLKALQQTLGDHGAIAVLIADGASERMIYQIATNVEKTFGFVRIARVPRGALVLGSHTSVETEAEKIFSRLPYAGRLSNPVGVQSLASDLKWLPLMPRSN